MALILSDLSVLAYANNFTLWHYKSENDDPRADNYFNRSSDMMNNNDLILCLSGQFKGILIVHSTESGHVVVKEFV